MVKNKKCKGATISDIIKFGPCDRYPEERLRELVKESCGKIKRVYAEDILKAKLDKDEDYIWILLRTEFIPERTLHQIAIFCWEKIAMPIWDKYYPDDKRPHKAVEIKKLWLDGKATDKELDAARAAASDAAWAAAWASAWAAARDAAWDAARDAAWAAASDAASDAARAAASDAAWAAAWAAAWDAARDAAMKKILTYVKSQIRRKS